MEKKIKNLKIPRNCSIRPVLIHVNGVEERVLDERYFDMRCASFLLSVDGFVRKVRF